jgi:hypothetical protein
MPKEILVLIASLVQPNLVVLGVRKHDMKNAFGGPNRKIMSPQGEAEDRVKDKSVLWPVRRSGRLTCQCIEGQ